MELVISEVIIQRCKYLKTSPAGIHDIYGPKSPPLPCGRKSNWQQRRGRSPNQTYIQEMVNCSSIRRLVVQFPAPAVNMLMYPWARLNPELLRWHGLWVCVHFPLSTETHWSHEQTAEEQCKPPGGTDSRGTSWDHLKTFIQIYVLGWTCVDRRVTTKSSLYFLFQFQPNEEYIVTVVLCIYNCSFPTADAHLWPLLARR